SLIMIYLAMIRIPKKFTFFPYTTLFRSKAYVYAKGKFVILEEEDLKELKQENEEKAVEIIDFVNITDIDPIYFNRSYYMSPNEGDRKSTRLNSSHVKISYAVFCLKKKT